jgi:hypothetical protein
MGRRGFIASLLSLGVSGKAAASLTSEELKELTNNPERDVPQIKYYKHTNHEEVANGNATPKRQPVHYTISRDRWVRINTVKNAAKNILNQLSSAPGNLSDSNGSEEIKVGITSEMSDAELGVVVQKSIKPDQPQGNNSAIGFDELKELVPSEASGSVSYNGNTERRDSIPVLTEKVINREQYFEGRDRPVPGGCRITTDWPGTAGTPVYDAMNGQYGCVSAAHVLNWKDPIEVYQPDDDSGWLNDNHIGDSVRVCDGYDGDFGVFSGETDFKYNIASETDTDGYDWDIQGIVSNTRIQNMVDSGEYSRGQGYRTGRDYGEVKKYFIDDSPRNHGPAVVMDWDTDGGDSGGPYYELDSDGAYIMGIHAWEAGSEGHDAKGNTMQYIERYLDVIV